jgi:hypothetical protein
MVAQSNSDLVAIFAEEQKAAGFGRAFLERFTTPAFGVLPKSEIELLVFTLLIEAGAINPDGPIFTIARGLNITPTKTRSLIFQYQLRHVTEADTDQAVLNTLTSARYWKAGDHLSFGVESPLVRAAIAARMRERGIFADVSLSGDILKVSPKQFGEVLAALLPAKSAQALAKKLRKEGINESEVRSAIKSFGIDVASDYLKDESKDRLGDLMKWVGVAARGHVPAALDYITDAVTALV